MNGQRNRRSEGKHCTEVRKWMWRPPFRSAPPFSFLLCQYVSGFLFLSASWCASQRHKEQTFFFFSVFVCVMPGEIWALFMLHNLLRSLLNHINKLHLCAWVRQSSRRKGHSLRCVWEYCVCVCVCVDVSRISKPTIRDQSERLLTSSSQINDSMVKECWSEASGIQQPQNP